MPRMILNHPSVRETLRRRRGVWIRKEFIQKGNPLVRRYKTDGGQLTVVDRIDNRTWSYVDSVEVDFSKRRRGIMTRLYEAAAEDACRSGRVLVSGDQRSAFAEAFWRKQVKRGRVSCLWHNPGGPRPNYVREPFLDLEERLAYKNVDPVYGEPDYDAAAKEIRAIKKKLPKPHRGDNGPYWSCNRWGLKRKLCKQPRISLEGL